MTRPERSESWLTLLAAAVVLIASAAGPPAKGKKDAAEVPPLNQKVLEFARGQKGKKVGDGQCTSLASEAINSAGAKHFRLGGPEVDYVWGRPVDSFREALPGDVVQFRDAVFRGKAYVTRTRWVSWVQTYPHHTAIVSEVRDGGKVVVVLHQNVGADGGGIEAKQTVTATTIRTDSLQPGGHVWVYRPAPEGDDESQRINRE